MRAAPDPDPIAFKSATRDQWDRCASGWNDKSPLIRAWLRPSTDLLLDMAELRPGFRVLDVAAGSGDQTLDIAERVGPHGSVLATDLSRGILALASENARQRGIPTIDTLVADGEDLGVPDASFDAAVCRLGLMFFPDPLKGLREMGRALKPGGRASVMVFSAPDRNPCVSLLMATAMRHAGLPPRDPYLPGGPLSLGRPGHVQTLFEAAGYEDVKLVKIAAPFRVPSSAEYLDFVRTSASPVVDMIGRLDPAAQRAAWSEIEMALRAFDTGHGWEGPNELLVCSGRHQRSHQPRSAGSQPADPMPANFR